jgi:hypothetical protein
VAIACSFAASVYAAQTATNFSSTKRGALHGAKKAEFNRKAEGKKFGIQLVKRNRWINDCIAR